MLFRSASHVSPSVTFDTFTGSRRPISPTDTVNKHSRDKALFILQTLKLGDEHVITFFDSGSDSHLILGDLAERLQLDIISAKSSPIIGVGNVVGDTGFGTYMINLGPSRTGELFELEVQGITRITRSMPKINLVPFWGEADTSLKGSEVLPTSVGGGPVGLLLGVKTTKLGPQLLFSLPSGLGVYRSAFTDVYGSSVCFGGPHPLITQAYKSLGGSVNSVNIFLTELASAFLHSPRTFIPCEIGRAHV